jgi:SAM-dependent methyltransferase
MSDHGQLGIWNETVGPTWARYVDEFDVTLAPFGDAAADRLDLQPGERVLDVGCGAGSTTRALAAQVSPGEVVGVDLSVPMIEEGRRRIQAAGLGNARLVQADVEVADLGTAAFDAAFSRMGVMFFPDPIRAFANVASALAAGGRLAFVCFQDLAANPLVVVPVLSAAGVLDLGTLPGPGEPGPFSLADPERIAAILGAAGFEQIVVEPGPDEAVLPGAQDLAAVAERALRQNPATAAAMARVGEDAQAAAIAAAAEALGPYRDGDVVRLGAASWVVSARLADRAQ